jgi:quinohemoprotein ethanol dehydrogenase
VIDRYRNCAGVVFACALLLIGAAGQQLFAMQSEGAGADWPSVGGNAGEWHYSTLTQINPETIGRLNLAWYWDIPAPELAVSTPLVVGGEMYIATGYSIVRSFDAVTGKLKWQYDPQVRGPRMRISWGIRGLVYWKHHIIVATADGRLISLEARTGTPVWTVHTIAESENSLYISGAPRVFNDRVIIGNAGADFGSNRGYVTTYAAASGRKLWRFYTVPGDPKAGYENQSMRLAAGTWTGEWWKLGGGGVVWNAITYDPDFHVVYIGTGNGSPWNRKVRSPDGGDNLFIASIVALDEKTGAVKWYYQVNPGDTWDYDAATDIELATLMIQGAQKKVLMQASKNGFFYVIDRANGKVLSAEKFAKATWASRIDLQSGRPMETPEARYAAGDTVLWPGGAGAHSWQPMSFSPMSGLVYIPSIEMPGEYDDRNIDTKHWAAAGPYIPAPGIKMGPGEVPEDAGTAALIAWDPVTQRKVWSVQHRGHWHGGTLATRGNLVFQGRGDGQFIAYRADTGGPLWQFDAQVGIVGAPMTFSTNGRQYVALIAGFGGSGALAGKLAKQFGWESLSQPRRVLVFALDGSGSLPPPRLKAPLQFIQTPGFRRDPSLFARGEAQFHRMCFECHGVSAVAGGGGPDLRADAVIASGDTFDNIVRRGALESHGMPKFDDLTPEDSEALRHYLLARAAEAQTEAIQP